MTQDSSKILVGPGIAVLKDRQLSDQIEGAETQLDWDLRQINRIQRLSMGPG